LRDRIKAWRSQDVDVVIVGNGNRDFAEDFRDEFELEGRLLVDPDLHAYRAAGLRRGRLEAASPKIVGNAIRALRSGARQTKVMGDPWQLGGVLVFAPGGELRFRHVAAAAGDHASPDEIEAALDESAGALDEESSALSPWAPAANAIRPVLDLSPFLSFDRFGFERHSIGFESADLEVDLYGRRCLVTGPGAGIGYEAALAFADLGAEVVLLSGQGEQAQEAAASIRQSTGNRRVSVQEIDLTSNPSVDAAVAELRKSPVDVLVHCAEHFSKERMKTNAGDECSFATNVLGPHRLTSGLASALEASDDARVIWVSSAVMLTRRLNLEDPSWQERDYDGAAAFAETKRAQIVLAELWAEAFDGTSVHVNSMHPGWVVDLPIVRAWLPLLRKLANPILRSPAEGADTIVWLAASQAAEGRTGRFFFDRQAVRTHWLSTTVETRDDRERLWQMCETE